MKEASTQVELESDYDSDMDSEEGESGPLGHNTTVAVVHNLLPGEAQSLSNATPPMITLATLSSELNLPNGDKDLSTLQDSFKQGR